eukprot:gene9905-biopygen6804
MPALPENVDIPEVSEAELQMAFRATPRGKAADFFGLTVELLALLPPVARAAMRAVFTRVLKQGLPSTWRRSVITPVCKPGKDPHSAASYRPVATTSLLCRMMERVALHRILLHLSPAGAVWLSSPLRHHHGAGGVHLCHPGRVPL